MLYDYMYYRLLRSIYIAWAAGITHCCSLVNVLLCDGYQVAGISYSLTSRYLTGGCQRMWTQT